MKDLITLVNQLRRYDSGYIHDIARQAEERKTGPIFANVTWTHMKVIANSIWKKLWD